MRGSDHEQGQTIALVQAPAMAGGPQNIFTEKKSAHLKAMIDQVKSQMGGNPTILRTPVKV
jgi:hypothetical protein